DTTSMQTFGANAAACKAAMVQGQVIVLPDSQNNQKYRVKKMPDGNVWMIDNFFNRHISYQAPVEVGDCRGPVENPGSFTNCGGYYIWYTVQELDLSKIWSSGSYENYTGLSTKMLTAAEDSVGNRNPVYALSSTLNFATRNDYPAPWLGIYGGETRGYPKWSGMYTHLIYITRDNVGFHLYNDRDYVQSAVLINEVYYPIRFAI
ncbi:MAG: hypothetical protein LBT85_01100, partial [Bifidobacteriaceae bacterium]|nr:hypothetical protein [Bifidobacteriaceae bacterium]